MRVGKLPGGPPMLELAFLAVAQKQPVSGKAFTEKIEALTGGWRISAGLVYPLIARMEREGLVRCEITAPKGRGRRELVYSPTAAGRRFLERARNNSLEHLNKMMSRMAPLAAFVCFGDDDPEFVELVKRARLAANEKIWRAAGLGKDARVRELKKIIHAIEKA